MSIFMHVTDMLRLPYPLEWLIRGFIETNGLFLIFGDPASGKSFAAVDIACCIATGTDWHGHKVLRGAVFYIAGEANRGFRARCAAWSIQNDVSLDGGPLYFSESGVNLSDTQSFAALTTEITKLTALTGESPRLIIIDTLARSMEGDENSARDMAMFTRQLDKLKDLYKCAILIVHHSGHGEKSRARGSSALKGALDAEFYMQKDKDGVIRFECTKMKEAEAPSPMAFRLMDVELADLDDEGNPVTKAAIVNAEYTQSPVVKGAGLGKNQILGMDALRQLMTERIEILEAEGKDTKDIWISVDDWRARSIHGEGMVRQRFAEVKKALVEAGSVVMDKHGILVRPFTSTTI